MIKRVLGIFFICIHLHYIYLKNTEHYKEWLSWTKDNKSNWFRKILVLYKVIYPPTFLMGISQEYYNKLKIEKGL